MVCAGALSIYNYDSILSFFLSRQLDRDIDHMKKEIKDKYNLSIDMGPFENGFSISGNCLNKYEYTQGLKLLSEEIVKYPPNFFQKNKVRQVRFLNNIRVGHYSYYGGYAGISDGTVGLAYDADNFEENREYFRSVFHHELFHVLDYREDKYMPDDKIWQEFHTNKNAPNYLNIGGRDEIDERKPMKTTEYFTSDYGQRSPKEDRAEFASKMMSKTKHAELVDAINNLKDKKAQEIMNEKYSAMKKYYYKWSDGVMDDKYWNDLMNGVVDKHYFTK